MELAIINESKEVLVIVKDLESCDFDSEQFLQDFNNHVVEMILREKEKE
jgi:hypothetical protein